MSYTLGSITLPNPKSFSRTLIESGASVITLNGRTKRDIINRKERYVLGYEMLSQTNVNLILSEYNLQQARYFTVSETNLTIPSTLVHIDIADREYNTKGVSYREDFNLILTEVI